MMARRALAAGQLSQMGMTSMMSTLAALVVLVAGLDGAHAAPGSTARPPGEPAPLVVFHAPPGSPALVADTRAALDQVAAERGTIVLDLSLPEPAPPMAAQALRQAIEAYHAFQYDAAQQALQAALDEAQRTGGDGLSTSELGDLYLYSALLAGERGQTDAAWDDLVHAAALDPTRRLDPVRFPPRVLERFQRAVEAVNAAAHALVRVDVAATCRVHLDSRLVGHTEELRMPHGHHYLRVRCPGSPAQGSRVVIAEQNPILRPRLEVPRPPTLAELRSLARERGARTLVVAMVSVSASAAPTLLLRRIDVRTGQEHGRALARLGTAPQARAELQRAAEHLLDGPLLARATAARPIAAPVPWYRRPWVWGVTGAALGAAALLPLVLDSERPSGFRVRPGGQLPP